ncbi:putative ribonuclease H-like domain-containing protein [Tanacetum coccineum]
MVKSWLVQDQTVLGKDYSNLLIADSLLKTIWFINAPCYGNEALASPKANVVLKVTRMAVEVAAEVGEDGRAKWRGDGGGDVEAAGLMMWSGSMVGCGGGWGELAGGRPESRRKIGDGAGKLERDGRKICVFMVDNSNGEEIPKGGNLPKLGMKDIPIEAIRLFLAYASFMNFLVYQMAVKNAFFYGTIEEEVEKALYGLHQAPRAWYETLFIYLLDNGFYKGQIDKTLFIKRGKGDILLVQVYVDGIIFGFTKKSLCTDFEQIMHKRFQISSMGELTFFLSLQVKQKEDGIFISQDKYVGEISKKFGFSNIRTTNTPMETNKALTNDKDGEDVDIHLYRSMIGSLMYLTSSRPDIIFSVCACSRFQVQPKVFHLNAIKRIFRYLKVRPKLGLWYPKDSPFILEAFSNSDYAGASLDRKCTTGGCQFLGSRLISWQRKK